MDKSKKQDFILFFFKADWGNLLSRAQITVGEYLQNWLNFRDL